MIKNDFFNVIEGLMIIDIVVVRYHASMVDDRFRILALIVGSAGEAGHERALPIFRGTLDGAVAAELCQRAGDGA